MLETVGPVCWQICPEDKPFRCGLLCTATKYDCDEQKIQISMAGFKVLWGIGSIGASISAVIGSAGMLTVIASFGLVSGIGNLGQSVITFITQLVNYPFCGGDERKEMVVVGLQQAHANYISAMEKSCQSVLGDSSPETVDN